MRTREEIEQEHAANIAGCVRRLNAAITAAAKDGIETELETLDVTTLCNPVRTLLVMEKLTRRLHILE